MITISLCMIVKNEERILDRCLSCVADLMDEIIIVDTGSRDQTKKIAAKYTDRIYDFTWIDDFAAARNFAFSKATGDYIYSCDADEVLDEVNRERFRILKENIYPEIEIVQMYYCNQLKFGSVYNYDKEYRPKLFRRIREFTWIDPIHETVRTEPLVFDSDIEIRHEQEESHAARDLGVFRRLVQKGEGLSERLYNMYARELFMAGESADFQAAEPLFAERCSSGETGAEALKEALCVVARAARLRGEREKFLQYALKIVACGGCGEVCMDLGDYYQEAGELQEAILWYYNAAFETESILDLRCSGEQPLLALADCYRRLGYEEQSLEYQRLAEERNRNRLGQK